MQFFPKITKTRFVLLIIIGLIITYFYKVKLDEAKGPEYEFVTVEKENLVQKVNVTGQVVSKEKIELGFETPGKVVSVYRKVGDKVSRGDILIELNTSELQSELLQANANLEREQAQLLDVKNGIRPEEILLYESRLKTAKVNLNDAQINLINKIREAYTQSDYAIRDKINALFVNANTSSPRLIFQSKHSQIQVDVNWERFLVGKMLDSWKDQLEKLNEDIDLETFANTAGANLLQVKSILDKLAFMVNDLSPGTYISQSDISIWKSDLALIRTNIDSSISNLSLAQEKINTTKRGLDMSRKELALKKAGNTKTQISIYGAEVKSAEARVKRIQAQIAKKFLRTPISGVISIQDAKPGQIISMNEILVTVIGSGFEIEVDIPEIDIAKVRVGNPVEIEVDAFENQIINGNISTIEPAEREYQGVIYYRAQIDFDLSELGERLKPGMSVELDIITDERKDVLAIPQRLIRSQNGDKVVDILSAEPDENGNLKSIKNETVIKIGLRGSEGMIEVLDGLKEGDKIIKGEK